MGGEKEEERNHGRSRQEYTNMMGRIIFLEDHQYSDYLKYATIVPGTNHIRIPSIVVAKKIYLFTTVKKKIKYMRRDMGKRKYFQEIKDTNSRFK